MKKHLVTYQCEKIVTALLNMEPVHLKDFMDFCWSSENRPNLLFEVLKQESSLIRELFGSNRNDISIDSDNLCQFIASKSLEVGTGYVSTLHIFQDFLMKLKEHPSTGDMNKVNFILEKILTQQSWGDHGYCERCEKSTKVNLTIEGVHTNEKEDFVVRISNLCDKCQPLTVHHHFSLSNKGVDFSSLEIIEYLMGLGEPQLLLSLMCEPENVIENILQKMNKSFHSFIYENRTICPVRYNDIRPFQDSLIKANQGNASRRSKRGRGAR